MKPLHRSVTGLLIAIASLPVLMSLLACIPVPLGDPENSRIDPDLNGLWIMEDGPDEWVLLFEPYDKRTWLVSMVESEDDETVQLFKAWRVKIGGEWFMTWQTMGHIDDEFGFAKEYWYDWHINKISADEFVLSFVNFAHESIDEIEIIQELVDEGAPYDPAKLRKARRALEKAIRRNIDDPEIIDTTDSSTFRRATAEEFDDYNSALEMVIEYDDL